MKPPEYTQVWDQLALYGISEGDGCFLEAEYSYPTKKYRYYLTMDGVRTALPRNMNTESLKNVLGIKQ